MSTFGYLERKIAFLLNSLPLIKKIIKTVYVRLNYLIFKSKTYYVIDTNLTVKTLFTNGFFGYYTSTPYNTKNDYICHGLRSDSDPVKNTEIDIILNGLTISKTTSWNYQQGAMLQWLDDTSVIHNIFENGQFKSKIINIVTNEETLINYPIYAVHKNCALSLNFSRLAKYRNEYGYNNIPFKTMTFDDTHDGIFLIDLTKNTSKLIVSIEDLKNNQSDARMDQSVHKVNHIQFLPDGNSFIFFHRWFNKNGVKYTRLYYSSIETAELKILADCTMISHCNYIDNNTIIGWMSINGINGYYTINIQTGKTKKVEILNEDGHPSITHNGRYIVTDTYPDRSGMQSVVVFDIQLNQIIKKASFFSPIQYRGSTRCDLHPRWDADDKGFTFDSVHNGVRELCSLRFTDE
ncbi:MAG: hypothetical protein A2015_15915 [Spirochaetes bacterium GWF1_31_7]|nr:MAG: hypothetical protein A2Y30_13290 [Spirochaetes bacterium GWE1_32_154]OHD49940.1 MAG: hypothetical protein A2Y29_11335 [Spirochaetes bacterium GWE2_31_10]OHD52258.1 MAG: hypothetical protein A2015_15915 [Spirochaetes bacterium GWF1_31_7]HBD92603.1 hypothetical protein [Spirochaetia bacterium]HBI38399.1 hypothetical protein [Spirochaetia bacterium]